MDQGSIPEDVASLDTLGEAIRWALARTPRGEFVDVVAQDEFTLDVVVRVAPDVFVVFDTT